MRDKLKATSIHLVISLIVALVILALLFWLWFPSPLMGLGAVQGVQIILIIDLVIGPLLTFIVFKKGKQGMVMDLFIIGLLQILALAYGLWLVSGQRPSYMVLTYQGLEVVSVFDAQQNLTKKQQATLVNVSTSTLSYQGVIPVVQMLEDEDAYKRGLDEINFELDAEIPYVFNIEKYQPIDNLESVAAFSSEVFEQAESCLIVTVTSPHGSAEICMAEQNGKIVSM